MPKPNTLLTALLPLLLLTACASNSQLSPVPQAPVLVSRQVTLPALPASAQQPTLPPECLPTCSNALTTERERWRASLTTPAPAAPSAPAGTTAPAH